MAKQCAKNRNEELAHKVELIPEFGGSSLRRQRQGRILLTATEIDNPQVQGIIVAIPNGGSDKYGVSNPQGANGKINIFSSPICH